MLKYKKFITLIISICIMFSMMPSNVMAKVNNPSENKIEYINNTEEAPEPSTDVIYDTNDETPMEQDSLLDNESNNDETTEISERQESYSIAPMNEEGTQTPPAGSFFDYFKSVLEAEGISPEILSKTSDAENNTDIVTLKVSDSKVLELLSQQTQTAEFNYKDWIIDVTITGQLSLGSGFNGLGDVGVPFEGTIQGSFPSIKTVHTLFKSLSSEATIHNCSIIWAGKTQDEAVFANELLLKNNYSIPVSLEMISSDKGAYSPFLGIVSSESAGNYTVTLPALDYTNVDVQTVTDSSSDIGLLCRVLENNTTVKVGTVKFPADKSVQFKSTANTGGLIGTMKNGSTLTITEILSLNSKLIGGVTAGGLVGSMESGASITLQNNVSIATELTANNSGGIAGKAETVNGVLTVGESSDLNIVSVKANASVNAGVLYGSCTVTDSFTPLSGVIFADDSVKEVSGPGNCGGVFGSLTLRGSGKCTIEGTEAAAVFLSSTLKVNNTISGLNETGNNTNFGGILGNLNSDNYNPGNVLVVNHCEITSTIDVGSNTTNYPGFLGGVVALQQNATLDASNSTISVINPTTRDTAEYGFGGICAKLDQDTLLIADTMKIDRKSVV